MKKRRLLSRIKAVFALCMAFLFCLSACTEAGETIKIGTGRESGSYYAYANNIKSFTSDIVNLEVETTAGSASNVRLLQNGFLKAAIVQNDILYSAMTEPGVFSDDKTADELNFSAVAGLYTESVQIVVKKDSDIYSVDDLKNKRVCVGETESGTILNAKQILDLYGLAFEDVVISNLSFEESAQALKNDEIDAFFCTAGAPMKAISDLAKEEDIRIISFSDKDIEYILKNYPYYRIVTLPAGTYDGIDEEVHSVGLQAVLVVSNKISRSDVKELTERILTHSAELNANIITDDGLTATEATENVLIAFHPGAADCYKSLGISVEEGGKKGHGFVFGSQDE